MFGWGAGVAAAPALAAPAAGADEDHAVTAASREEISEAQGIVRVVMGVLPSSFVAPAPGASAGTPACPVLALSPPSEFEGGDVGHASTTVVVMGTLAPGISVHPQWSIVTVVVRHVSVLVGHVIGSRAQIVVYVVEMIVGERDSGREEVEIGDVVGLLGVLAIGKPGRDAEGVEVVEGVSRFASSV